MNHSFELFMCCPGGGTVICNKAVTVNNDYKQIGFIYHCGKLKWYVDPKAYVPEKDLIRIEEPQQDRQRNGRNGSHPCQKSISIVSCWIMYHTRYLWKRYI